MKKIAISVIALVALASCGQSGPKMDVTEHSWEGAGSSPDWAFRFMEGAVQFEILGETGAASAASEATIKGSEREFHIEATDSKFKVTVKEDKNGCNDGVSQNVYPYRAKVTFDGKDYEGCAREYVPVEVQGATKNTVTIETGSGTQATITNTTVQTSEGQVGVVSVSTGSIDEATMEKEDEAMMEKEEAMMEKDGETMSGDTMEK